MKVVTSRSNPLYRSLLRLKASSRERRLQNLALIEGTHLVGEYIGRIGSPRTVAVSVSGADDPEVRTMLQKIESAESVMMSDGLFRELSSMTAPAAMLAAVDIPPRLEASPDAECCLLLEDIQDPGNLGSILRTAAAAGATHALLSPGCADAWSPRVLRAGMGAQFFLNVIEYADIAGFTQAYAGQVIAMAPRAKHSLLDIDLRLPTAFMLGNEGAGLSPALLRKADCTVSIPMPGGVESINVAAAAAVCLFERVRQVG